MHDTDMGMMCSADPKCAPKLHLHVRFCRCRPGCKLTLAWRVLQILDDGRVTDSQGRTVSFKNTILIMTSNLGSQAILEGMASGAREAVKDTVMSMVHPIVLSYLSASHREMGRFSIGGRWYSKGYASDQTWAVCVLKHEWRAECTQGPSCGSPSSKGLHPVAVSDPCAS